MYAIDRAAIILKVKEPMVEWIRSLGDDNTEVTLEKTRDDSTVYLVPLMDEEIDTAQIKAGVTDACWEQWFELELSEWAPEEDKWPENRTRELFDKFIDVECHSLVFDLMPDDEEEDGEE
jgi:hypothetical protein